MAEYDDIAAGLPHGWRVAPLSDLVDDKGISYGIVQPGNHLENGVPIVRVKDLKNGRIDTTSPLRVAPEIEAGYARTRLSGGEVLLSLVGSVGESAVAPKDLAGWNVARAIAVVRTSESIPAHWLNICFSAELAQHHIRMFLNTTVQATLNLKDLRKLPITLPPAREMEAITNLLCALDDKLTVNSRIGDTASRYCSALFQDIVVANSTGTIELHQVATVNAKPAKPIAGRKLRYVDISSVSDGALNWPKATSWEDAPGRARRGISVGDTLWSTVRPNRRSRTLVLDDDPLLVASTGFAVITPRSVGPAFLYENARREEFVTYLESVAEGSAYPAVRSERFLAAPVLETAEEHRSRFEELAFQVRLRAHAAVRESRVLANLRDTLLPELMSGRLRVKDAEKVVEGAV